MLSRLSAVRRLPRTFAVRYYTDGRREGSVAQSQGFNKKEKAHEDQYIRQQELQKYAKLRAEIKRKEEELAALKGQEENHQGKV